MERIAQFEKVSKERFVDEMVLATDSLAGFWYDQLLLPNRATVGSAGYDFHCPMNLSIAPGQTVKIPTGIRVKIEEGWVLQIFPRSSLGFKFRCQLDNTVGIVDQDYYYSDNEGHIFIKMTNDSHDNKTIELSLNDRFAQGIFIPFGITVDDTASGIRNGGLGSTN